MPNLIITIGKKDQHKIQDGRIHNTKVNQHNIHISPNGIIKGKVSRTTIDIILSDSPVLLKLWKLE